MSTLKHSTREMQSERVISHNHSLCGLLTFLNPTLLFWLRGVKLSVGGGEGGWAWVLRVADDEETRGSKKKFFLSQNGSQCDTGSESQHVKTRGDVETNEVKQGLNEPAAS